MDYQLQIVTRAYNQAQQGLQSTAQTITKVAVAADQATAASGRLNQAYSAATKAMDGYRQSASGLLLPVGQLIEAEKKAAQQVAATAEALQQSTDATQQATKATEQSVKATEDATQATQQSTQATQQHAQQTQSASSAAKDFFQTLGALGLLRGFQQALSGVTGTYRQFSAEIKQAALIADDFSGVLQHQAMVATQGIYGPKALAEEYRDLGAAGLSAKDAVASSTDVLNLATAAMIDQSDAAQAVIAGTSSFQIPFSQASRITDAFAEAMNRTTLGGKDLSYALASIGPVAGMAGQGLGETIAAVAALRNAGAQAQDAATSVRAAMQHLVAPTAEAKDAMKALGIQVFDSQGTMKQWSAIVAEFERALQPYNQQTRQLALTTIMGSDGVRAMAASMQMGSRQLADLGQSFEHADGAAARMASAMGDTLDGVMRRLSGNMERASITIGQDLSPAMTGLAGFLNTLVSGFTGLDASTRHLIEWILGSAGLVLALSSVVRVVQMLSPGVLSLVGLLARLGPVLTTVSIGAKTLQVSLGGILGILGLVAAAVGLAYGAWQSYEAGQQQATMAGADHATQLQDQAQRLRELTAELQRLKAETSPTADEQDRMRQITGEIVELAPEAASGIDLMTGQVRNLGDVLQGTNAAMERMLRQSQTLAQGAATAAKAKLPSLQQQQKELQDQVEIWTEIVRDGPMMIRGQLNAKSPSLFSGTGWRQIKDLFSNKSDAEIAAEGADKLNQLVQNLASVEQQIADAQTALQRVQQVQGDTGASNEYGALRGPHAQPTGAGTGVSSGGKDGTSLFGPQPSPPSWLQTWKDGLQATMATLDPFKATLTGVSGTMDILNAKQQYYLGLLASGRAGVEALSGAEQARVQIIAQLQQHQAALHQANDANRAMLGTLANAQKNLDSQYAAGKIGAHDYAEASAALRQQTDQLSQTIYANSAAWWHDEQSIASAQAAAGQAAKEMQDAQQRLDDQAYQQATATMRHEVAMRQLSVDQQIALIRQMLREMALSTDQAGALQEQLMGLYGDKIKSESDRIQKAYQDALDSVNNTLQKTLDGIDSRLKRTIAPLQAQLDALDARKSANDRERATEQHNKKLADLMEQRHYHEIRTGQEHQKALQDLDKQIADENEHWQQQQDDWRLEDQRQSLQDQIKQAQDGSQTERDQAQEAAKKQRADLDAHYKKVKEISEQGILDTIAALAATDPQWFATGKGFIDQLIAGLQTGDFSTILSQLNSIQAAAQAAQQAAQQATSITIPTTNPTAPGYSSGLVPMEQAKTLIAAGQYEQAAQLLSQSYGMSYDQATQNIKDFVGHDIPGFARGAFVVGRTIAEIGEAGPEVALPLDRAVPVLGAAMQMAMRQPGFTGGGLERLIEGAVARIVQALTTRPTAPITVYGAQTAVIEDQADVDTLGRGIARQIARVAPIGG